MIKNVFIITALVAINLSAGRKQANPSQHLTPQFSRAYQKIINAKSISILPNEGPLDSEKVYFYKGSLENAHMHQYFPKPYNANQSNSRMQTEDGGIIRKMNQRLPYGQSTDFKLQAKVWILQYNDEAYVYVEEWCSKQIELEYADYYPSSPRIYEPNLNNNDNDTQFIPPPTPKPIWPSMEHNQEVISEEKDSLNDFDKLIDGGIPSPTLEELIATAL
ncbi:MAG: hypothetical protein KC505_01160 [Myxococcales bacterium]|nr:hypothetical protein [Myxococcales bacterium]USN50845.1 MAG: hypothetical protein H6731_00025 [Myxococcales bacterium]